MWTNLMPIVARRSSAIFGRNGKAAERADRLRVVEQVGSWPENLVRLRRTDNRPGKTCAVVVLVRPKVGATRGIGPGTGGASGTQEMGASWFWPILLCCAYCILRLRRTDNRPGETCAKLGVGAA